MPNEFDYSAPFMSASIVLEDRSRVPIWQGWGAKEIAAASNKGLNLRSFPYLQDVTIETQLAHIPRITATLVPPFNEGMAFLNSELAEFGVNTLDVQFGYVGAKTTLSPIYSGLILKPNIQVGQEITISLEAQGIGGFSASMQQSGRVFNKKTRMEIIKELLQATYSDTKRNIKIDDSEVLASTVGNTSAAVGRDIFKLLNYDKIDFSLGYLSDWAGVWILLKESLCSWFITKNQAQEDVFKIIPLPVSLSAKPTRTLALYELPNGQIGPVSGVYPIISVITPELPVFLPGSTKALIMNGIDTSTNETLNKFLEGNDPSITRVGPTGKGGRAAAGPPDGKNYPKVDNNSQSPTYGDGGAGVPGADPSNKRDVDRAKAELFYASAAMGIKLNIETIGIPDILPGEVIAVRGLGKRFSFNYGVFKVTHKIGTGGFTTELEVISNTNTLLQDAIRSTALVNDQQPDASSDGTTTKQAKQG